MTLLQGRNAETTQQNIDDITVPVETDVFAKHPNAAFFVGVVATPQGVTNRELYRAAARLRYNVYVKEKGLMHPNLRTRMTQHESDSDDPRSVHFVVVKNNGPDKQARVVGGTRLIVKRHERDSLPVEKLFPEAFALGGAAVNGSEASRFIARSDDKREQHTIARALIRALAIRTAVDNEQPVYAVADRLLLGMFRMDKVHYESLSEPRVLDEYMTDQYSLPNSAVSLNAHAVIATMTGPDGPAGVSDMYHGIFANQGVGYFDANMAPLSSATVRN
ncbi:MAG TPA: GNAT family N-acyltransferase [Patescibacteria group bacterium]|nr:GNAT family N-acyltransferase [Patescibacteria group bacterium]